MKYKEGERKREEIKWGQWKSIEREEFGVEGGGGVCNEYLIYLHLL